MRGNDLQVWNGDVVVEKYSLKDLEELIFSQESF